MVGSAVGATSGQSGRGGPAAALLRADGERLTGSRLAVLAALEAADGHLTAAQLYRQVLQDRPRTSLSTVYRTVERLIELSLVHVVSGPGEASFGLSVSDHDHAVCEGCGRVLPIDPAALASLDAWAYASAGFRVRSVELRGHCSDCQGHGFPTHAADRS